MPTNLYLPVDTWKHQKIIIAQNEDFNSDHNEGTINSRIKP